MTSFTQKYTIVQLIENLPDGYRYSMQNWPLHVTLADVFAIDSDWTDLLYDLEQSVGGQSIFYSDVTGSELFGEDKAIKVKLLENTKELQGLHGKIVITLEKHGVVFNSPQYVKDGFVPHSTEQGIGALNIGDEVEFNSITLIDMFPDEDPYQRQILGTIRFT